KFLLRHGRRFTGTKKAWSQRHGTWLRAQTWPLPALEQTHGAYVRTVDEAVGAALRGRQRGAPEAAIARAWTAQQRLYRRYHRLAARGKPSQQVNTAVARELTGFVWAVLTQ